MPRFLNTRGQATLGIGVCDRCKTKRMLGQLVDDGNVPGLKVCAPHLNSSACWDTYDPFRLPPRQPDRINLPFARPDQPLFIDPEDAAQLPIKPPREN